LAVFTSNPANILKLHGKGKIEQGVDADLVILDKEMNIKYVVAKGVVVKSPTFTKTNMFE
jgi:beta-aspartyl-dipeptidase (metallo-type)